MNELAVIVREVCGCVVGATVITKDMHYIETVANWKRGQRKRPNLSIETVTVDEARDGLGHAIDMMKRRGRHHWRTRNITPLSCMALASRPEGARRSTTPPKSSDPPGAGASPGEGRSPAFDARSSTTHSENPNEGKAGA